MSQFATLVISEKPVSLLCHMGDFGCGDGGWTPVMKIDGNKVWVFLFFFFSFFLFFIKSNCQSIMANMLECVHQNMNNEKPAPSGSI